METPTRVDLLFTYRIKDGQDSLFEEYLNMVPAKSEAEEPYVLEYELFRHDDGTFLQHERYEDEAAITKHLEVTAEGQAKWGGATELLSLTVIGELSQEFWDAFDGPHVTKYSRFRQIDR